MINTVLGSMTLQERAHGMKLGSAGRRVLTYIDDHPIETLASSAAEIAARASTSNATVIRTVQTLGFAGMAELKKTLAQSNNQPVDPAQAMRRTLAEMTHSSEAAVETVLRMHEDGLAVLRMDKARTQIAKAALVLDHAKRIVVFGIGPSAGLAHYVTTLLRRTGRRSSVLDRTGSMLADQLLDLGTGDVLLLLAYGRVYREVRVVITTARAMGLPVVLLTEDAAGRLAKMADTVVAIPRGRPGRVALHGVTMVALEAMMLALSVATPEMTLRSLERLTLLRSDLGK